MSIIELGALGEFLGSIGVIATLIYLSVQVRQNTRQVEQQARGQRFSVLGVLSSQWSGFRRNVTGSVEIAGVWRRGNTDPNSLSEDESALFDLLMVEMFWGFAYNWITGVEDGLGEYLRDDIANNLLVYDSPGMRAWWGTSAHRVEYPADFVTFVDELLGEA
jgi:hypothetical protein